MPKLQRINCVFPSCIIYEHAFWLYIVYYSRKLLFIGGRPGKQRAFVGRALDKHLRRLTKSLFMEFARIFTSVRVRGAVHINASPHSKPRRAQNSIISTQMLVQKQRALLQKQKAICMGTGVTYSQSGVDIDKKDKMAETLVKNLKFSRQGFGANVNIGSHFSSLIDFGDYYLSLCTDGVGTKILLANEMKKWDTIGIDCIAMNVNDMICVGAEPISFVDYIAIDKPDENITAQIGVGLDRGAELSNMSIVGGETAILSDMVHGLDLAGTCLGFVKKGKEITGSKIKPGDAIIGLRSSGIHSNGYTLVRKIIKNAGLTLNDKADGYARNLGQVLLEPTKIYVKDVLDLINRFDIHGLANITGGGLWNIPRLNANLRFEIHEPIRPQPIFDTLKHLNNISDFEMYQTFNMGMGFCIVANRADKDSIVYYLQGKCEAKIVGEVVKGKGVSVPDLGIEYK